MRDASVHLRWLVLMACLQATLTVAAQTTTAPSAGQSAAASAPSSAIVLTLPDAIARAKENSPQFRAALMRLGLAREDRVQARAALLPGVNYGTSFIYTQGNGTATGRFIANNGVHEYVSQGAVHQGLGLGPIADYQRAAAAQALAAANAEIATRGLVVTVVQAFYGLLAAQEKSTSTAQAAEESRRFLDLSNKLEVAGEVAHSDVIKAQIQANESQRQVQEAQLAQQNARLALAVLLFPDFNQNFALQNDLAAPPALLAMTDAEQLAKKNNPELRAAMLALNVADKEVTVAKAGHLPWLALDYFYGIDANQFALHDRNGFENLGYSAVATLNIPVWNWGAIQSKVKQAELQRQQAKVELSAAQRQAIADFQSFYAEAETARTQVTSLRDSADLAAESLRLTNLRYQAGEATALEVVDAQNTVTITRNALYDQEVRYRVAIANLQTLTGAF